MKKEVLIKILEDIPYDTIKTVDITYVTETGYHNGYGRKEDKTETLSIKE